MWFWNALTNEKKTQEIHGGKLTFFLYPLSLFKLSNKQLKLSVKYKTV